MNMHSGVFPFWLIQYTALELENWFVCAPKMSRTTRRLSEHQFISKRVFPYFGISGYLNTEILNCRSCILLVLKYLMGLGRQSKAKKSRLKGFNSFD